MRGVALGRFGLTRGLQAEHVGRHADLDVLLAQTGQLGAQLQCSASVLERDRRRLRRTECGRSLQITEQAIELSAQSRDGERARRAKYGKTTPIIEPCEHDNPPVGKQISASSPSTATSPAGLKRSLQRQSVLRLGT